MKRRARLGAEEGYEVGEIRQQGRGQERFGLFIVDERKSERVRPSLSRLLLASEWEDSLVVECAWCGGRFDWLIRWQ